MKKITNFEDIETLSIPDDVKEKLLKHLIEPFGSYGETKKFWDEVSTIFYLIEESDTDVSLDEESDEDKHYLHFVTDYTECVLLLGNDDSPWLLALAIVTSEGGCVYCCASINNKSFPVVSLVNDIKGKV